MNNDEKKVTNENNEQAEKINFQIPVYLSNYIKENPIKSIITIILSISGISLLIFFLNIGFMPDISFESVSLVFYAISILSIIIFLFLIYLLATPIIYVSFTKIGLKKYLNVNFYYYTLMLFVYGL